MDTLADAASPEAIADAAARLGCRERRVHVQRPRRSSSSTRSTSRTRAASAGSRRWRSPRATCARSRAPSSTATSTPRTSTSRRFTEDFYRQHLRRPPAAGARHARVPAPRDRRLARDHDAAHPRPERRRRRARRDDALGRRAPRPRRADALHGVPSRLQDARPAADAAVDARARARASRSPTASATCTPGTCTIPRDRRTYCAGCGEVLVGRDGYVITTWSLGPDGRCGACDTRCAGVLETSPGRWGSRRLPVRLGA